MDAQYQILSDQIWVNATAHTETGLTNGTEYTFDVRAVNASGDGATATIKATPYAPPIAPTNLTAAYGDAEVTLGWTLSDASVTRFEYQKRAKTGAELERLGFHMGKHGQDVPLHRLYRIDQRHGVPIPGPRREPGGGRHGVNPRSRHAARVRRTASTDGTFRDPPATRARK